MKRLSIKVFVLSMLASVLSLNAIAQQEFVLDSENSKLLITGTSSAHDWEMQATNFSCETVLKMNDQKVTDIKAVNFSATVEDIESGKRIMDNKAHDALEEKNHPIIMFSLKSDDQVTISDDKAKLSGTLSIAGKSRDVEFTSEFMQVSSTRFSVNGSILLKMTDFGIDPPTAMFGALQTGNEIKINFDFKFEKISKELSGDFSVK
jgi:polyisoprenoid-binding protein YceI